MRVTEALATPPRFSAKPMTEWPAPAQMRPPHSTRRTAHLQREARLDLVRPQPLPQVHGVHPPSGVPALVGAQALLRRRQLLGHLLRHGDEAAAELVLDLLQHLLQLPGLLPPRPEDDRARLRVGHVAQALLRDQRVGLAVVLLLRGGARRRRGGVPANAQEVAELVGAVDRRLVVQERPLLVADLGLGEELQDLAAARAGVRADQGDLLVPVEVGRRRRCVKSGGGGGGLEGRTPSTTRF